MPQPTARQRRQWLEWYFAHGEDATATCARYGIHRSTLYRWRARHAAEPAKPLRARSRRPHTTRQPTWTSEELLRVCAILCLHPAWGRGRVAADLQAQTGTRRSEATVGRLLARMRTEGCPVCHEREGRHNSGVSTLVRDLVPHGGPAPTLPRPRRPRNPEVAALLREIRAFLRAQRA